VGPTTETISAPSACVGQASLFGAFSLTMPDGAKVEISSRRARALLAMLCFSPGEALERDHVSKLLWPGRFQAQARASLRQCLLGLDKALAPFGGNFLDTSHSRIAIDPARVETDLGQLETALAERRVSEACQMLEGIGNRPFLDQMDLGGPFGDWQITSRAQAERRLQVAVDHALAKLDQSGDAPEREKLAEAWRTSGRAPAAQRDDKIRIAVLPFAQHDAIGGDFFLADGVTDELGFRLGGISSLALVGRTSIASVVASGGTLPAMAGALGVSHLIEGDVHRFAEGVRVSLRLIEGHDGTEIWSDRYDGTVADAIGSRAIIGNHFVSGLCKALGVDAPPAPVRRMTTNREAYALFLQGREMTLRTAGEGVIAKGQEMLETALRLDPDFAECWAALAETHLYIAGFTSAINRTDRLESMAECARKAIALDPVQGHARGMLACMSSSTTTPWVPSTWPMKRTSSLQMISM
jgi:TolB-like protein